VLRGDVLALATMAGQSLLVAFLIILVFGDVSAREDVAERGRRAAMLLFLLDVCCFWFGCNNAAKALVKERAIYLRERAVDLNRGSYFAAKVIVLFALTALQTFLLAGLVRLGCRPPGLEFGALGVLLLLAGAGTALGLTISAAARTEDVAVTLIPLALIPQIILANVLLTLEGAAKTLAEATTTVYWGNRGLTAQLPADLARDAGLERPEAGPAAAMLLAHCAVFLVAGLLVLTWRDRGASRS
jgi:hypothetical protein